VGGWLSGKLQEIYTVAGIFDYSNFWYTLAGMGLVTGILFFFFFNEQLKESTEKE